MPRLASPSVAELTSHEVWVGLLSYGLFAEKIPPCFNSEGLSTASTDILSGIATWSDSKLEKRIKNASHDYMRYQSLRDVNIPRHMGIPHPESYALQAFVIAKYWDDIRKHCDQTKPKFSRVFARRIDGKTIFEMNYKGWDYLTLEESEIEWRAGARYQVKADISTCFPSIYTHSIPWALIGKSAAKMDRSFGSLGNKLDSATQRLRDSQTNGLLIGPHSSNIISEIVLTQVDSILRRKKYRKVSRHVDDYCFYASTHEEAEKFIRDLGLALREFELFLNEKKTKIFPLPAPKEVAWVRELNRFVFPEAHEVRYTQVRILLDLALDLAEAAGTSAPLNYAMKMIPENLNPRARRLYVQEAINLALSFPYLSPILDQNVFSRFRHAQIGPQIEQCASKLIALGYRRLYPDAIAHGLYYSLKYHAPTTQKESALEKCLELDDCITSVLLLEYAKKHKMSKLNGAISSRTNKLKSEDAREIDKQWLLAFHTWSETELRSRGQGFLADLKKRGLKFLDL